jgi:SAM-dependent methyltransferase
LVLDVGAGMGDMLEARYPWRERIVAVERTRDWSVGPVLKDFPQVRLVLADGCALPFRDGAFDIVFSNAVIEHVPRETQNRFAQEIRRVGKRYFVATPNRWFPLETHSKLLFLHWLPHRIAWAVIPLVSKYKTETWLLSRKQMQKLFPDARVLHCGPSLIAYRSTMEETDEETS